MSAKTQSALRLVVDNTLPAPEHDRREKIAFPLIALAEQVRAGGLAAVFCISVEHNGDAYLKILGQIETEIADEALHGVQALGKILCKRVGRQPGTAWVDAL